MKFIFTVMHSMPLSKNTLLFFFCILFITLSDFAHAHNLSGKVEVEGGKNLKNLVVYIEPVNPSTLKPKLHKIMQKGRQFNPNLIVVSPGDKIQFLNDEDREIDHNIYSLSRLKNFDLGLGERGSVLEVKLDRKGSGNFYCSVHKLMEGRIISLNTRHYVVLEKPGNFIIPNVPPGDWILKVFVFHRRYKSIPINVSLDNSSPENVELKVVKK